MTDKNIMINDNFEPQNNVALPRTKFKLICASQVKRLAKEYAKANRAQKFTRVGEEFLIACESNLRNFITARIDSHPSKGKTLM